MEIIRSSLKILFNEIDLSSLFMRGGSVFDEERFIRMFQKDNPYMSLDQCLLSVANVRQYYMRPFHDMAGYAFSERNDDVLNMPLHFTRDVLIERDSHPVCRFEHLLRWHTLSAALGEDMLTTSYLASRDECIGRRRNRFDWHIVIRQDDPRLNNLFEEHIADVHMHLKGSSGNFDLNWMSLMNHILGRSEAFQILSHLQCPDVHINLEHHSSVSLYSMAIKACAIRLLLYKEYCMSSCSIDNDMCDFLIDLIDSDEQNTVFNADRLDDYVRAERFMAILSEADVSSDIYDYIFNASQEDIAQTPNSILQGERFFLYSCFRACYGNRMRDEHYRYFYAYLLIKNKIRNELIQTNEIIGFRNFDTYERRKTIFINEYPIYRRVLEPLALCFYYHDSGLRYIEPRIAPCDSAAKIAESITDIDNRVEDLLGRDCRDSYHYVIHFIKQKDRFVGNSEVINSRHFELREIVHKQAMALHKLRTVYSCHDRIVGIDAANSEIATRPEVFAQAFRYLRFEVPQRLDDVIPKDLGMTYHVGEDFISVTDGLRAVDEVLHFMRFMRGDRLGHALVLGVDVNEYMRTRHNTFLLSKQMLLDDISWILNVCDNMSFKGIRELEYAFYSVFKDVYGQDQNSISGAITVKDYYDSWLLRGDNPCRYMNANSRDIGDMGISLGEWAKYDLNDDPDVMIARNNRNARELYHLYHFSGVVRRRGNEIIDFCYPDGSEELISSLQQKMLAKLVRLGIGIETNPTSNIRIGGFRRYSDHPIHKFFPIDDRERNVHLLTSVNTDDRGVFATSIEREYALLACAQFKLRNPDCNEGLTHDEVIKWLDELRRNGLIQRFFTYK